MGTRRAAGAADETDRVFAAIGLHALTGTTAEARILGATTPLGGLEA